jgi:hypothetical protein
MKTEFLLLTLYEKPFLTFVETCEAIGISAQTGYHMRSAKTFPIALIDSPLRASVQDVAEHIDLLRDKAKEKMKP